MMTDIAATATNHRQNMLGLMAFLIAHVSLFGWVIACRFLYGRATPGGHMPIPRAYVSSFRAVIALFSHVQFAYLATTVGMKENMSWTNSRKRRSR